MGVPHRRLRPVRLDPEESTAALVVVVLARAYRAGLLTLLAVALAPSLWHWEGYVVRSDSMRPAIAAGDVVVARPFHADERAPVLGRVVVAAEPGAPGGLVVHRVARRVVTDRGVRYELAGDANAAPDVQLVARTDVRARALVLVPLVGRPVRWARTGAWGPLTLWLGATVLAFVLAAGPGRPGGRRRRDTAALALVTAAAVAVAAEPGASAGFAASTRSSGSSWTVGETATPYTKQVIADDPYAYYPLDDASLGRVAAGRRTARGVAAASLTSTLMADRSGHGRTGSLGGLSLVLGLLRGVTGALGGAIGLSGGTDRLLSGGSALWSPQDFTVEMSFRTTTKDGGKLFGFESSREAISLLFDRQLFMRADGRLVYGRWPFATRTLVSPRAYNDGAWHDVAVSVRNGTNAVLYVDGAAVASGTTAAPGSFYGWWRFGFGSIGLGPDYPAASFDATVDDLVIYTSTVPAGRISAHHSAH